MRLVKAEWKEEVRRKLPPSPTSMDPPPRILGSTTQASTP